LLKLSTKKLVERALQSGMVEDLGHGKSQTVAAPAANTGNSKSKKTRKGYFGELFMAVPRACRGYFGYQLVTQHRTGWSHVGYKLPFKAGAVQLHKKTGTVKNISGARSE